MDWLDETLAEFGQQLGLPSLRLNAHGVVRLSLESGKQLTLEPMVRHGYPEVLLSLGDPVGHAAAAFAQAALQMAHVERFAPLDIQLALSGHGAETLLIATTRLSARACTPQALAVAIRSLDQWLDDLMATGDLNG